MRWRGVLLALCVAGCGEEGELGLSLVRASFDDPYTGVDQFVLRVLDDSFAETERLSASARGDRFELGVLASGTVRLEIQGLSKGQLIARGQTRPLALEAGSRIDEPVPFSTARVAVALPASRALAGGARVDGSLDDWRASPSLVLEDAHRVSGAKVSHADLRAEVLLAWESSRLHFALRVEDDCPALRQSLPAGTCGTASAVERIFLGFDGQDDGGQSYGSGDLWVELVATGVWVRRGAVLPGELGVVVAPRPDLKGWVLEGTLAVAALGRTALALADRVGLDLVLVDEDPRQSSPTILRWSPSTGTGTDPTPPASMGTLGFGQVK